ncbi:Phage minor capsid protein 2 [Salinibacillus kushneri]|uniref:Phage minor capsid protein 2 n=1 Tax=Salinibacillus kushneri TaxID=237682 RepID=A0A1I0IDA4_9BACI|nr:phage minor capsid protein [Salinibacillus kushneri]SET94893.1 Phage minor capsid protein 2 [Salinibacillus kushneri]
MAISPNSQEKKAVEIGRIYADAENRILRQIARRLAQGIDEHGWREKKITQFRNIRQSIEKEIENLDELTEKELRKILTEAYGGGMKSADADIRALVQEGLDDTNITLSSNASVSGGFGAVNQQAVEALAAETVDLLKRSHVQILRNTEDQYRNVVSQNIGDAVIGAETRRQATQRMLNEFADKGISNFVDKAGNHWEMQSYTEMATRASLGRAAINGHMNSMQDNGMDLAIVSDHPDECPDCKPWERQILSISGEDTRYPSVSDAEADGLFHPGCGHTLNAYVEGLTKVETPESDGAGYEVKKQQRYNERQIRRWKRRESVAMDEAEQKKAKAKIREWQARNRKLVENNNLRRKYEREQIKRAR